MKLEKKLKERKYYKIINYRSPNLTSDSSGGLTVSSDYNRGGPTWKGFSTTSGYSSGNFYGRWANETWTTLHTYITNTSTTPLIITGYTYFTAKAGSSSSSEWTPWHDGKFYGSTDNSNWILLHSHGQLDPDATVSFSFTNSTPYKYYRYDVQNGGDDFRDQVNIASFHLLGSRTEEGTAEDYDYYVDIYDIGSPKYDNKYYAYEGI